MSVPVQTDPFFGRQDHVDALRRVAHDVSTGHPAFVIMRGEAGIGKTRLVSEFSRELSANDWLVRIGGCTPLIGPPLAFGPSAAASGGGGQHWWTPEPRRPETTAPVLDQIGDGLLGTLANEQTRKPVAIVLEDLHWADRSSMALLAFVVRGLAESRRVLIWATAREEYGPDDEHEVELVLSELIRRELTVTLPIGQLTATDVRQVALAVAGAGADPEWIESIVRRSAGNPYFAR